MSYGAILGQNNYVKRTGDTMTGPLVLPGDPTEDLQATTKQYVDAKATSFVDNYKQNLIGSVTITGSTVEDYFQVPNIITLNGKEPIGALYNFICNNVTISYQQGIYVQFQDWRWYMFEITSSGGNTVVLNGEYNFVQYFSFYGRGNQGGLGYGIYPAENRAKGLGAIVRNQRITIGAEMSSLNTRSVTLNCYLFY